MPKDECESRRGKRNHGDKVRDSHGKQKTEGGRFQSSHSNRAPREGSLAFGVNWFGGDESL